MSRRRRAFVAVAAVVALGFAVAIACVSQPFVAITKPPSTVPSVDPARLEAHVRKLAVDVSPRSHDRVDNLDAAAAYLRDELARHAKVEEQTFGVAGKTYRNVIASLGPSTTDVVVVGAHYDAAGGHPGADDDASGVAGLLELAPLLAKASLGVRVELVAYTLEEPPYFATEHMGSVHHADALAMRGARVRAMLSLEMIGCFRDEEGSQRFPAPGMGLLYPTRGNFIALVGRPADRPLLAAVKGAMRGATDLPVHSLAAPPVVTGVDWSDHRSYWKHEWPAVMVTDTSFLRNDRYHTPRDTPETLDYARMAKVVQGTWAAVLSLSK